MTAPDLSPAERAHVDRIEQAPDALGLREEVAEVATAALVNVAHLPEWMQIPALGRNLRPIGDLVADALLPLIERREAEAAERALREAMSGASFGSLGAAIHKFRCTDPDCHHWDDPTYFTPRDNDAASACHNWLRDRADQIGGTR